ncbi:ferritin-like protein [Polyporus arcularius HHB13444]|uniref:Ferritin-like protein n=1 Tax=Polyporus arcularius HHB13444 TaxID=1314778 RepID=A0A5C3P3W7_9APHY|nr:ferritin-like protein [Polyporus arcularius HHB13444]
MEQRASSPPPVLSPGPRRFVLYPIRHPDMWNAYKSVQARFWTAEDVQLRPLPPGWDTAMSSIEKQLMFKLLVALNANSMTGSGDLIRWLCSKVQLPEARSFYGYQLMTDNIHAEIYAITLSYTTTNEASMGQRAPSSVQHGLVAVAITEAIFSSATRAVLYWLQHTQALAEFCHANERIILDRALYTAFSCMMHTKVRDQISEDSARAMVRKAVHAETTYFFDYFFDIDNPTLVSANRVTAYIKHVADQLLIGFGYPVMYNVGNPFYSAEPNYTPSVEPNAYGFISFPSGDYARENALNTISILDNFTFSDEF